MEFDFKDVSAELFQVFQNWSLQRFVSVAVREIIFSARNFSNSKSSSDFLEIWSFLRFQEFLLIEAEFEVFVELVRVADQSLESLASCHHLKL
jgi:hypothetical protein